MEAKEQPYIEQMADVRTQRASHMLCIEPRRQLVVIKGRFGDDGLVQGVVLVDGLDVRHGVFEGGKPCIQTSELVGRYV